MSGAHLGWRSHVGRSANIEICMGASPFCVTCRAVVSYCDNCQAWRHSRDSQVIISCDQGCQLCCTSFRFFIECLICFSAVKLVASKYWKPHVALQGYVSRQQLVALHVIITVWLPLKLVILLQWVALVLFPLQKFAQPPCWFCSWQMIRE
jgi:hypothetical protein